MAARLQLLLDLYEYYLYWIPAVLAAAVCFYRKREKLRGTLRRSVLLVGGLLLISVTSAIMTQRDLPLTGSGAEWLDFAAMLPVSALVGGGWVAVMSMDGSRLGRWAGAIRERAGYGLVLFFMLVVQLFSNLPETLNEWGEVWYAADYSMGLGSRFLIGSLLTLFNGYVHAETAYRFCVGALILLIGMVSWLMNGVIRRAEGPVRTAVFFLTACMVASPGFIQSMWSEGTLGRLETYTILLDLLAVICLVKIRNDAVRYGLAALLPCVSMAVYQGDIFMYYPLVLMVIAHDLLQKRPGQKKRLLLAVGSVGLVCAAFLFFQLCTGTIYETPAEFIRAIGEKSDVAVSARAVELELFEPLSTAFRHLIMPFIANYRPREMTFVTLALLMPLALMFAGIYFKCFSERKRLGKPSLISVYTAFLLIPFAILPQFMLNIDWGRWMTAYTINMFFGIFYLIDRREEEMLAAAAALDRFVRKHWFIALLMIAWLAGMSDFPGNDCMAQADRLTELLVKWGILK